MSNLPTHMLRNWYARHVPRKAKPLEPLDFAVIEILGRNAQSVGMSQRGLASAADMTLNRVGILLRAAGPGPTIGEIGRLAAALGLTASAVVREAEEAVAGGEVAVVDPSPQTLASVHRLPAAEPSIPLDLAARTVHHRPERDAMHQWDDVGEESQINDDEGEEQ